MKNSRAIVAMVAIAFVLAIGAMAGSAANAAIVPTVALASASSYSVLAGTPAITNVGLTTIDRDVGIHPANSITGFPPGLILGAVHPGDALALQAKSDLTTAYLNAANRVATGSYGALGGQTIPGGVYTLGSLAVDLTGNVILDGANDPNSVWIFKSPSTLITASASSVTFINGGNPCNVFWQVSSSATLGSGSSFVGTILALTSITLANGVTVQGRALARNGDVTLINDRFITSTCNAAPTSTVAPTATPIRTAAPSVTPTTAPTSPPAAATPTRTAAPVAVAGLPSTSTGDPAGPLTMLGIALTGIGIFLLRSRAIRHL